MIDLCAAHKIYPETEVVPVSKLSDVYTALDAANDSGVRYVLDIKNTLNESAFAACEGSKPPTLQANTTGMSYPTVIFGVLRMTLSNLFRFS